MLTSSACALGGTSQRLTITNRRDTTCAHSRVMHGACRRAPQLTAAHCLYINNTAERNLVHRKPRKAAKGRILFWVGSWLALEVGPGDTRCQHRLHSWCAARLMWCFDSEPSSTRISSLTQPLFVRCAPSLMMPCDQISLSGCPPQL